MKILGHPVHQQLVVLPLGILSGAVIFDVIALATRTPFLFRSAFWIITPRTNISQISALAVRKKRTYEHKTQEAGLGNRVGHAGTNVDVLVVASADDDPPGRVARTRYREDSVSFQSAGETDWVAAVINQPMTTGDQLWANAGSRAEVQIGSAMIRVDANTGFSFLNLDDRTVQVQLTDGTLNLRGSGVSVYRSRE